MKEKTYYIYIRIDHEGEAAPEPGGNPVRVLIRITADRWDPMHVRNKFREFVSQGYDEDDAFEGCPEAMGFAGVKSRSA